MDGEKYEKDIPFIVESFPSEGVAGGLSDHRAQGAVTDHHAVHQGDGQTHPEIL